MTSMDRANEIDVLKKAAGQGDTKAQVELALYYLRGGGVDENKAEAVKWLQNAVKLGSIDAQAFLGECLLRGIGTGKNEAAAMELFRDAAEQGHPAAQFFLGAYYMNGLCVETDKQEALKWLRKSAEQGFAKAQFEYGRFFLTNNGIVMDTIEGKKWLQKAAEQGHPAARKLLDELEANPVELFEQYKKAAELGDVMAQHNLGCCYSGGQGVEVNKTEGFNFDGSFRSPSRFIFDAEQVNLEYEVPLRCELIEATERVAAGRYQDAGSCLAFAAGARIFHPTFGNGVVQSINEQKSCYVILFDEIAVPREIRFNAPLNENR